MPFISKNDYEPSTLTMATMDLAALLDTAPNQVVRWERDGLLKRIDGNYYEPMQAIVAVANWNGRGRIPKPVRAWRALLGAKERRRAFLDGMTAAFNMVSTVEGRRKNAYIRFGYFREVDPAYEVEDDPAAEG